jgi:hypothetical protein
MCPSSEVTNSMSLFISPPRVRSSAARRKKGIAQSMKLSIPANMREGTKVGPPIPEDRRIVIEAIPML